jgi:transcriptional regulator with GAF, ATPase, and Fis domain
VETLPDDARARRAPPPPPPQPYLFVLLEAERPLAGGTRHALANIDEIAIGRGDARAVRRMGGRIELTLPDGFLSARHARIVRSGNGWTIEDLGSRNGVRVDGEKRPSSGAGPLGDGALIEVGHTLLTLRHRLEGPSGRTDLDCESLIVEAAGLETLVPPLERELMALGQVARATVPVLLAGATGTGKEVIARAVHALSGRPGAFVAVNCGALPATLVESELFGVRKGAYSGAVVDRPGLVRAADGGTLFLDEIGDLPLPAQVAFLRVLQEREVTAVGDTRPTRVDLRVVAASHRQLPELVDAGRFRSDLYARLAGFTMTLPGLAERRDDIGLLTAQLLRRAGARGARLTPEAAATLFTYGWPLNIRELEQRLTTALALAGNEAIDRPHLGPLAAVPPPVRPPIATGDAEGDDAADDEDDAAQRARLIALLTQFRGNVTEVAKALGRSRLQVYRWLHKHQLDPRSYR